MKRIISFLIVLTMVSALSLSLASCGKEEESTIETRATYTRDLEGTVLNVYNWAEYISDGSEDSLDVNAEFEKLTGIKVNYSMYESNEVMYSKLKSGSVSYDIIIPSDYMIERLKNENMLKEVDFSKITNYDLIDSRYKGLYYDPDQKYSAAYNVGYLGLIYNPTMVDETPDSWGIMWNEKYKDQVLNIDNPRDGFLIAQVMAGVDVNSENTADWDKAGELLRTLDKNIQGYVMDQVFNKMEQGNAAIAPYYAGDFLTMKEENEDLEMVYPKEGTNIFVDAVCIPDTAKNYEAALMYMNFLLEPEIALANAEYIRYASPNTSVLTNPDYSLADNEYLYPKNIDEIKSFYYHDLSPETLKYYEELWQKIKSE